MTIRRIAAILAVAVAAVVFAGAARASLVTLTPVTGVGTSYAAPYTVTNYLTWSTGSMTVPIVCTLSVDKYGNSSLSGCVLATD
jgi:hypothetical protein